jgi:hypothetical protein
MTATPAPFLVVRCVKSKGVPWLETIENVPDEEDLKFGVSRVEGFPKDAAFSMSEDYEKDVGLADVFKNVSALLVVSERVRRRLESIPGALFENEVLPVQIINHRKRVEEAGYFIIHQLNHPRCLDEASSKGTRMAIRPKLFQLMNAMVIDAKAVPPEKMLFRVEQFP